MNNSPLSVAFLRVMLRVVLLRPLLISLGENLADDPEPQIYEQTHNSIIHRFIQYSVSNFMDFPIEIRIND